MGCTFLDESEQVGTRLVVLDNRSSSQIHNFIAIIAYFVEHPHHAIVDPSLVESRHQLTEDVSLTDGPIDVRNHNLSSIVPEVDMALHRFSRFIEGEFHIVRTLLQSQLLELLACGGFAVPYVEVVFGLAVSELGLHLLFV